MNISLDGMMSVLPPRHRVSEEPPSVVRAATVCVFPRSMPSHARGRRDAATTWVSGASSDSYLTVRGRLSRCSGVSIFGCPTNLHDLASNLRTLRPLVCTTTSSVRGTPVTTMGLSPDDTITVMAFRVTTYLSPLTKLCWTRVLNVSRTGLTDCVNSNVSSGITLAIPRRADRSSDTHSQGCHIA